MLELSPEQTLDYFRRSYSSVDGLWFMKVEEEDGFDKALELDEKVWQVMPKIQARAMKTFLGKKSGLDALRECFETKLSLDGFVYSVTADETSFTVRISHCPWYDKLVKSKREHFGDKIANRICKAEYAGWAAEFGCAFMFNRPGRICSGCTDCELKFQGKKS